MANSPAPALLLREGDRAELLSWSRSTAIRAGLVQRAKLVLLAADGVANARTAVEDDHDAGVEVAQQVRLTPDAGQLVVWSGGRSGRLGGLVGQLLFVL